MPAVLWGVLCELFLFIVKLWPSKHPFKGFLFLMATPTFLSCSALSCHSLSCIAFTWIGSKPLSPIQSPPFRAAVFYCPSNISYGRSKGKLEQSLLMTRYELRYPCPSPIAKDIYCSKTLIGTVGLHQSGLGLSGQTSCLQPRTLSLPCRAPP